jgi:maleate cis-trans isomerase
MMEALEKVEKDIKKPLLRSDKANMATLMAEFDKINKKYVSYLFIKHL